MRINPRRINPRRVKINFSYSVHELSKACGVTRRTVRHWRKQGLRTIDETRPYMFHGTDARAFLSWKRRKNKRPCGVGEIYCMRCRQPKISASNMADYHPRTEGVGTLIGLCPDCGSLMNRHVSLAKLSEVKGQLDVRMTKRQSRLVDSEELSVTLTSKAGGSDATV